jgi:transposase
MNGERFCDFIKGTLIPNMLPYDGLNPTSIVVMDNCSIHHVSEVQCLLEDAGIVVIYLPPYSPDFNPIETAFSYVKQYLKKHDDVLAAFNNPGSLVQSAFDSITIEHCQAWISHCHMYGIM